MIVRACNIEGCACYTLFADQQVITTNSKVIKIQQNEKTIFVGGFDAKSIKHYAHIPALDFSISLKKFNTFTKSHSDKKIYPDIWQRPSGKKRIGGIVSWLNEEGNHTMPDAIILGETRKESISLDPIKGVEDVYNLKITHQLKSKCKSCGEFKDKSGKKVFQSRCTNHDCSYHTKPSNPFQIIDGQHRTLALAESKIKSKQVPIVFLLKSRKEMVKGFDAFDQARIFEQINTESVELHKLHKLWLRRFFKDWRGEIDSDEKKAFDLMVSLGSEGSHDKWENMTKIHPRKPNPNFLMDSLRGADRAGVGAGAFADIMSTLEEVEREYNVTKEEQLTNYLIGSEHALPHMLSPGAPFRKKRLFEVFIKMYPRIFLHAKHHQSFSGKISSGDFRRIWEYHKDQFNMESLTTWNMYTKGVESAWQEFKQLLELMWPSDPNKKIESKPYWHTSEEIDSWKEYALLSPDPVVWRGPATKLSGSFSKKSNGSTSHQPYEIVNGTVVDWYQPRNTIGKPTVEYSLDNKYWIDIPGKSNKRKLELSQSMVGDYFIRVTFRNFRESFTRMTAKFKIKAGLVIRELS